MPRARAVTPWCGPAVSSLPRLAAEPGSRLRWSGFSALSWRDPTRLPRIRSTVGDQPPRLDQRPAIRRRHHRGRASIFRPPLAVAPLREVNDDPPRPSLSPSCRWAMHALLGLAAFPWLHRRDASNPLLQPTFRVTSTRSKNTLSGDFPPSAVGKPAGVRLRDPLEQGAWPLLGKTPDHLAVIRPPAAPCLTARHRLRTEQHRARSRAARGERSSFFGCLTLRRSNPLTPPGPMKEQRVNASPPFAEPASTGGTSMPSAFTSSRCLPPWKPRTTALAGDRSGALLPLADGRRRRTSSSRLEDLA
jgi:hypothetical protein